MTLYTLPKKERAYDADISKRYIWVVRRSPKLLTHEEWWHQLSPSPKLIREYHRGLPVKDFFMKYRKEMERRSLEKVDELAKLGIEYDVFAYCYEEDAAECHRSELARICKERWPALKIDIK